MAYYRLRKDMLIRGWDKLPFAVVDTSRGRAFFVSKNRMRALDLCDGIHDFDSPLLDPALREELAACLDAGFIEPCRQGETVRERQRYLHHKNRFVSRAHWAITGKCNYRCKHCFMDAPDGKLGELSHEALLSIVRQISECGVPAVSLTGGEPLIRPDFFEIVEALTNEEVRIDQLYTNGALLDEKVLRGLEQLGQHPAIIISYDGVGFHDWVRGVPGAERMADRAIRLCQDAGFAVRCQMCLYRDNSTALRTTVNHLAELGCDAVRIGVMTDRGNWRDNGQGMTLSPHEFFELGLRCIHDYYEDGMPVTLELSNMFAATPDLPDTFRLLPYHRGWGDDALYFSCARRSLQMRPAACDEIDSSFLELDPIAADDPGLRTVPLSTLLSSGSAYMDLLDMRCSKVLEMSGPCSACKYYTVCLGGCHAQAHETYGSIYERDPVACEFWTGGWAQKIVETVREIRPEATTALLDDPLCSR